MAWTPRALPTPPATGRAPPRCRQLTSSKPILSGILGGTDRYCDGSAGGFFTRDKQQSDPVCAPVFILRHRHHQGISAKGGSSTWELPSCTSSAAPDPSVNKGRFEEDPLPRAQLPEIAEISFCKQGERGPVERAARRRPKKTGAEPRPPRAGVHRGLCHRSQNTAGGRGGSLCSSAPSFPTPARILPT